MKLIKILNIIKLKFIDLIFFIKIKLYTKEFKNFEECKQFCLKKNKKKFNIQFYNFYHDKNYNLKKLDEFEKNINATNFTNSYLQFLTEFLAKYIYQYKALPKILDIGGDFGGNHLYLKKIFEKEIVYDILETETRVKLSKKNLHFTNYFSNFSEIKNEYYDIVYSSGTIQYTENYQDTLNSIFQTNPKFIVLVRNNFGENGIFSAQYTPDGYIPNQQVSFKKLEEMVNKYNYKILRKINIQKQILEGNIGEGSYGTDLVLKKVI